MCRLLGYCSRDSASVAGLLTQEGLRAFTALSHFHCDGWGMAWYDADGPQVRKSPRRAAEEPEYARLAQRPLGDLGLVHLRWATPGLGIGYPNSHPFRFGPYTFAHNGAVHPQDRLGELLPAEWERRLAGTTDSERYLLHIMWRLEVRRGDMIAAVADTVASIAERYAVNSLNAVLLSPAKMYVISWHDPARIPADELRRRGLASTPEEVAGYFHLACQATPDAVVVASSGWPQPGWTMLPNNSVLAVDRVTLDTLAFSLEPASPSPAGRLPARLGVGQPGEPAQPCRLGRPHVGVFQPVPGHPCQVWPRVVPHGRPEPAQEHPAQPAGHGSEPPRQAVHVRTRCRSAVPGARPHPSSGHLLLIRADLAQGWR